MKAGTCKLGMTKPENTHTREECRQKGGFRPSVQERRWLPCSFVKNAYACAFRVRACAYACARGVRAGTHVHVVAGLEDDGRQQPGHEELKVKLFVLRNDFVAGSNRRERHAGANQDANACLWQSRHVVQLEDVAANEGAAKSENANDKAPLGLGFLDGLCL